MCTARELMSIWSLVHGDEANEQEWSKRLIVCELNVLEPRAREAHEGLWSKLMLDCELILLDP